MSELKFGKDIFLDAKEKINTLLLENIVPFGCIHDYTDGAPFAEDMKRYFKKDVFTVLDLGCSTGNVPMSMRKVGIKAIGLEGSIWPKKLNLGAWKEMPDIVDQCNLEEPFKIVDTNGVTVKFDVISAWEVIEHIGETKIDNFFRSIQGMMHEDTVFVGTIFPGPWPVPAKLLNEDYQKLGIPIKVEGEIELHKTQKPIEWWIEQLNRFFRMEKQPSDIRYCRISDNIWCRQQ